MNGTFERGGTPRLVMYFVESTVCGRITFKITPGELQEFFEIVRGMESISDWEPRYNVAPTTPMVCFRQSEGGRELFPARWGLIPSWAKDAKLAASAINAKSETVAAKPMFRSAFKSRRCVVIASGFYEWQKMTPKQKQPYYITLTTGEPMPFAGLWEWWRGPGGDEVVTCTICTTAANTMMAPFHDRMPVILPLAMIEPWLDPQKTTAGELQPLLSQYPSHHMRAWPVSIDVGNVRNQGSYLIEPAHD